MKSESRHQRELLLKLSFEHGAAELAGDVERVMRTLCSHPKYELFPINYRIEGRTAVHEFYKRMLASNHPGGGNLRVGEAAGNLGDLNTPVDVSGREQTVWSPAMIYSSKVKTGGSTFFAPSQFSRLAAFCWKAR